MWMDHASLWKVIMFYFKASWTVLVFPLMEAIQNSLRQKTEPMKMKVGWRLCSCWNLINRLALKARSQTFPSQETFGTKERGKLKDSGSQCGTIVETGKLLFKTWRGLWRTTLITSKAGCRLWTVLIPMQSPWLEALLGFCFPGKDSKKVSQ